MGENSFPPGGASPLSSPGLKLEHRARVTSHRTISQWRSSAILNKSPAGRHLGFDYSLNPYRGCSHACRYCYARDSHKFLGLDPGLDFEQKLFVKDDLPSRMREELRRVPIHCQIAIGTVTDPYQPLEGHHLLTRQAILCLSDSGHAFTITTKSPLIERDLDILEPLGQRRQVGVQVSLISLNRDIIRALEPGTSPPQRRLDTIRRVKERSIPIGVFVAPIIPGLTDGIQDLDHLFDAIKEAGADWVMAGQARLTPTVRDYLLSHLKDWNQNAYQVVQRLYADHQYGDNAYHQKLNRQLDELYHRYHLSPHAPTLLAYEAETQITFPF